MIVSIRQAQLPLSYSTLYQMSRNPQSPFYCAFLRVGNKIALDLEQFRAIALKENQKRASKEGETS